MIDKDFPQLLREFAESEGIAPSAEVAPSLAESLAACFEPIAAFRDQVVAAFSEVAKQFQRFRRPMRRFYLVRYNVRYAEGVVFSDGTVVASTSEEGVLVFKDIEGLVECLGENVVYVD